jgi:hypothetical protein
LAARIELRPDAQARPGNVVVPLARLLRKLRDAERHRQAAHPEPARQTGGGE